MKKAIVFIFCMASSIFCYTSFSQGHPILAIGSQAPDFNLPGIDGKMYSLNSFKDAKLLVIVFMCNHCPTSQAYEDRIMKLADDYKSKGVAVVGINSNSSGSLQYYELGWSDVGDSFDDMKVRAADRHFNFPYLYDGDKEEAARAYGPVSTPHVFILDEQRKLRYAGRVDDMENPLKQPHNSDAKNAIEALLNNKPVPVETTKVFGCSIKWLEKNDWLQKAEVGWAKEPVSISDVDNAGVRDVLKDSSDKLRLVYVWSTADAASANQFDKYVTLSHIYVQRDFELVTINTDAPGNKDEVLQFLKTKMASNTNYLFGGDKRELSRVIGNSWHGDVPYTLLIEPGGNIVYKKQGLIDAEELRKIIFNDKLIGRLYPL